MLRLEEREVVPHVAMNLSAPTKQAVRGLGRRAKSGRVKIEARRRMHEGLKEASYHASQGCRKKLEEGFGWIKTVAGLARTKLVGQWKLSQQMHLAAAAYNLVRMRKLMAA